MATVEPIQSQSATESSTPSRGAFCGRAGRVPFLGIGGRNKQQQRSSEASTVAATVPAEAQPQSHTEQALRGNNRRRRYGKGRSGGGSVRSVASSNNHAQELIADHKGSAPDLRSQASGSTNDELHFDMSSVAPSTLYADQQSEAASVVDGEITGLSVVGSSTIATSSSQNTIRKGRGKGKGKGKGKAGSEGSSTNGDNHTASQRGSSRTKPKSGSGSPRKRVGANLSSVADSEKSAIVGSPDENRPVMKLSRVPPPKEFGGQLTTSENSAPNGGLRGEAVTYQPGESTDQYLPPHLRGISGNADNKQLYTEWGPPVTGSASTTASLRSRSIAPTRGRGRGRGGRRQPQIPHIPLADGKPSPRIVNMRPQTNANKGAEQMGTRIHREIASGVYECVVCCSNLTRKAKVWNCKCCWAVFHLSCIQKWAKQGLEEPPSGPVGAETVRAWRCPTCNNHENEVPANYSCWCEKEVQPEPSNFLSPHSCGQSCGKKRSSPNECPHACDLQCHAGPCPPCTSLGSKQPCHCGKDEMQKRCIDTVYEGGWSCGQVCEDIMPCGEHQCPKPCHPGVCGDCQEPEVLKCFCGNSTKGVECCDKSEPVKSMVSDIHGDEEWLGYWNCNSRCDRYFDCTKHTCKKSCHPQDALPARCPRSPDVITRCPCGKTKLSEILESPRANCEADIPSCDKICRKILRCGHKCEQICHEGDCAVCVRIVEIKCSCGKTISESLCHNGEPGESPQCMRVCRTTLNCGRHECGGKCCSGEARAHERLNFKKRAKTYISSNPGQPSGDGFESEHICTRPCGRPLKCGAHNCQMLCHRGPCGTCLEASFDELSCNCGKTVVQPPVPCGTKPPVCVYSCARDTDCGHPQVPHFCHTDDVKCPSCPYLVEKTCLCGKKGVKNVPCFGNTVSCGTECGKKLSCGSHNCQKVCHAGGDCNEPCKQQCGKTKSCRHACLEACHAPFQCPEVKPCSAMIQLTCPCGGLKQDARCCSTKANATGNKKELKCNDQCRSRRMALALEIDPDRESIPPYSDGTLFLYAKDKKWATSIEEKFRGFTGSTQKRLIFSPMKSSQRAFLHSLAVDYGFESESQDPEPYRSVIVFKGSNNGTAPRKTIAEYITSKPSAAPTTAPVSIQQLKKPQRQAYNSLILQNIRIGMLNAEIEKELEPVLKDSQLRFALQWSGDEDVLLIPKASSLGIDQIELELADVLSPQLKRLVAKNCLADKVELAWVGRDGLVVNRESEPKWSLVAGKSTNATGTTGRAPQPEAIGSKSRFDVENGKAELARKSAESLKKKREREKKKEVDVVDDWETAADDESESVTTVQEVEKNDGEEI